MLQELKTLFAQQAEQKLLQTMREFHSCKQEEGQSVSSYVLKMNSYIDNLERLGHPMTLGLGHKAQPQLAARGQNQWNGKNKLAYAPKPKIPPPPKRKDPAKDSVCHQCGDTGHWKRNCRQYLTELMKNNKLSQGASGIILVSCLYDDGYVNRFMDNSIQVFRNNMVYFSDVSRDGIFEIDLSDSYTNVSSMYALSNKKAKSNLDSALLWHCRLRHINKKRIEKLQHDGLLNSTDLRAFEKSVPCMSRNMARKPYTHQVERAKDLLGLIHTDVCGSFKIMSRQGASYFVIFTDDFCRYGYVYLLKHKHKVFETFKVFQKEVENQLSKTIKSLRSDHGGEYTSQEFLDHLKDHGIIAHRTPPYTPQHNGVSERRNKTLLDMVRSMKSQITLPKYFWDYSLDTTAHLLNVVPTKKVEKTPYEVWHGQAPKLSYLKVWGCEALVKRDTLTKPDKELGDLGEPANYKVALLDPEYDKWLNAMNVEIQSMKDSEGYTQTLEINYEETFSSVADIRAIKILIAIAAFMTMRFGKWMSKLHSSMYISLKRSTWSNLKVLSIQTSGSNVTFLILYVDDILIMENNIPMLQDVKSYLGRCFAMKDLGEAAYILGIKIYRDRSQWLIGLCQSANIEKILKRYHMENSKRGIIPMQDKLRLSKSQGASTPAELKRMQNVSYASAMVWTTVKNILKYLRNTKDMVLVYGGDIKRELKVSCYTYARYLTDADDLKSQTGYVFILNRSVVDWKSAKQSIFATSSAKAKYIAAYDDSKEAVWVRKFILGLGVVPTIEEPISMYCDNTGAITIANESGITKGARYFHAKVRYLRELIEYGDVKLEKVHTDDNLADPFIKVLVFPKHSEHTKSIGMLLASSLM
nr:hypothetical protein [Tanacetum cinerariifolium]